MRKIGCFYIECKIRTPIHPSDSGNQILVYPSDIGSRISSVHLIQVLEPRGYSGTCILFGRATLRTKESLIFYLFVLWMFLVFVINLYFFNIRSNIMIFLCTYNVFWGVNNESWIKLKHFLYIYFLLFLSFLLFHPFLLNIIRSVIKQL